MKRNKLLLLVFISFIITLVGCSSDSKNPEESLSQYIDSWSNHNYDDMLSLLNEASLDTLDNQEWSFTERYGRIYNDLGIEEITIDYEPIDFKEENIDLSEINEIAYPVHIEMDSLAGPISYSLEIVLIKEFESENEYNWKVVWHPSMLLKGLKSPTDTVNIKILQPDRGEIYDRNGEGLAINDLVYQASIVPDATEDLEQSAKDFAKVLNLDEDRVISLANQYPNRPEWAAPIQKIALNNPRINELLSIDGVLLNQVSGRKYPYGSITGHLIGHIGLITAEELNEHREKGYSSSSMIGKNNLELVYEDQLRGSSGAVISVNGENDQVIAEKPAVPGEDIYLSIDINIQQTLSNTLKDELAAGVVMNPTSGEVLALVSEPAYDLNLRYLGLPDPRAVELDDTSIFFERRFQNTYSPGSIFKPFTAVMAIEENTLVPEEIISINDRRWQPDESWGDYHITRVNNSVNEINLNKAMLYSDNIYFAKQALELGASNVEKWAEIFGFGETLPFEFPVYTSSMSNTGLNSEVLLADTGYGQGQVQVSPVHITTMYSIFLNEGSIIQPTLLLNEDVKYLKESIASTETINTVLDALIAVVEDNNGTAYRSEIGHNRNLAGKTGTAELKENLNEENGKQLGWYVSFDYEKKDLLTTIMTQEAEKKGGSSYVVDLANTFWKNLN
ncbi:penicillin-binding transpeptidase domain-containing protein [Serpentinicella sp. ANB-PHB4]|uniref:penicillin-binding transpeptidase domain-containing protein n=1 Tax=Serpentinicella sp. ANB-PHB4 TaxID=3074076 RepID=UPI002862C197|nr:penicillin-binding transpeptidase domain-containing protein [Serpentinicella sp. ANB-PHB4]MDR5659470.1 penicillin-binding transpeptidase domain-containing protein [Serpentinicella sp. ANB-PHB4]